MRILQIIQKEQLRGAEIFASQLSNHLTALGHEVHIVSLYDGSAKLPFNGPVIRLSARLTRRFTDFGGWRRLARFIRETAPDVVQANAGDTFKFAVLSKLIFRWKTPIVLRNANKVSDFIDSKPKLVLNRFLTRHVDFVISVSELCRQDFIGTYDYPEIKTVTIPIGIDHDTDRVQDTPHLSRDFRQSTFTILNVGSLVEEKNHEGLLRITQRILNNGFQVDVLIAGDGRLRGTLEEKIKALGLSDRVKLLGFRNDVFALMKRADILAMPSLIEGLPGVILEAFSNKLPVVAYNVGGISEVIKEGNTGWLVEKGDEDTFTQKIQTVLHQPELADSVTSNAFRLVSAEFSNRKIAAKFAASYERLLNRSID